LESKVLLVTGIGNSAGAEAAAFAYAKENSSSVVALQVVTSNLYHYGHVDLIATRPSKRDFLVYIREEMVARAQAEAERLRDVTEQLGISLEVISAETEDVRSTVIGEAKNGYCAVFVPHQKRRIFPLLERNLGRELKRKAPCQVVLC
jgi:hypothetical protein